MILVTFIFTLLLTQVDASNYGDRVAELPVELTKKLAEVNAPNNIGAIGRNKSAYFHVRFQTGMHHIVDYGLASKKTRVIDRFLTAVAYSLNMQLPDGDFKLVIPDSLKDQAQPSMADRVSGVAFFASSLGLGIHALETNSWFMDTPQFALQRQHLATIKPKLRLTLEYLLKHQAYLETADKHAPNRLLFDALAFQTLGKILDSQEALVVASSFVTKAIAQVHPQDGYFIEAGGYDSSYNAVAVALTLRLLLMGDPDHDLKSICTQAIQWQEKRVLDSGEVSTEGNSRVRPKGSGESFLGRKKDVDVGHVVEAFMLASQALSDTNLKTVAQKVIAFYQRKRQLGR